MPFYKILVILGFCGMTLSSPVQAQSSAETDALNAYINFLNESVHGMVIAHILLVNNNKDLNRFIDLDATKTVNITTKDLPSNIFDKPDDNSDFYEVSPIELSEICYQKSKALGNSKANSFNSQTREIVGILNRLNQLRFDIENYILSHDLNQKESIYGVYDYLEEAVALFENYSKAHNKLASDINGHFNDSNNDLYRAIKLMHGTTKDILRNIRKEQESSIDAKLTKLNSALLVFKATLSNMNLQNEYTTSITDKVSKTVKLVESYQNPGAVPYEHELYGKHYYYHNQILIKYFNWSGPGFVRDMNTLMDGLDISFVKMDEEPLIFKVIYPTKVEKAKELEQAKPELKKRKLTLDSDITFNPTSIKTDSRIVEIELFDNNMIDRDSISVQFNGENILENYSLSGESKFITVTIEDGKENLLIITAKNLGIIPPNTTAVAYRYQGKRQRILIENDLNVSEAIRVKLVKPQD